METSDKARGEAVPCVLADSAFWEGLVLVLPDGEIEDRRESNEMSGGEPAKEGD